MTLSSSASIRFAGWEIRPSERLLLVAGKPVRIGSRAFDLLLALAERPGQVVGKRALMDRAWPDVVVEENNLSVQITALRKLLGAAAIVNVSGVGFQLASQPQEAEGALAVAATRHPTLARPALLGRDTELRELAALLGSCPLLSIVGAGGVGKSVLAQALAASTAATWRDGTHWIDLGTLRDGAPLMPLMAASLGVVLKDSTQALNDFVLSLSQLQALIVLDNAEHLLDELAAIVAPALDRAPGIRWLLTSREPLRLRGASAYRLEPLSLPPADATPDQARHCAAVALFCARARAADQRFEPGDEDLEGVTDICRQLDGLPLAIEMAAARVPSLGLGGVRRQLGQKLRLSAGPHGAARHHTLLQTLDWSYGLLDAGEQRVFRHLAPFVGGFTAAMVQTLLTKLAGEAGAMDEWQALDALGALVDKSLVQQSVGAPGRLHLLESARDFARLRLADRGEEDAARRGHAEVVAGLFGAVQADFEQMRDQDWAALCMPERHNVGAALAWAVAARHPELLARLVTAQAMLDVFAQTQAEVVKFDLPLAVLQDAPPALRARARLELGWAHYLDGRREFGTSLALQALADFEALGDVVGCYRALMRLTRLYGGRPGTQELVQQTWRRLQQIDETQVPLRLRLGCAITVGSIYGEGRTAERLQELQDIARRAGFDAQAAVCRTNITDFLLVQGRFEAAVETARTMLQGDESRPRSSALLHHNLALSLVQLGRVEEARSAARAAVRALPSAAYLIVDLFALAAARDGRLVDAALMAGYSAQVKRDRDLHSEPTEAAVIDETIKHLRAGLGADRLEELLRHGAAMPVADVLAMALPS